MLKVEIGENFFQNNLLEDYQYQNFVLDSICEFSRDAIVVLDFDKNIITSSKQFQNLFAGENILGMNFINLIQKVVQLPNDFFNQTSYFLKVQNDEEERVLQAQVSSFKQRYVVILKDVTEKKELEAQRDNFIATLTHDLKTPVRADIMSLELLLKGKFG